MNYILQDGKIEAEVKLTGILSLGALQPGEVRKYGTTIAPGLYAPVHQHFFVARMDMAVDCKPGEAHNQVRTITCLLKETCNYNGLHRILDEHRNAGLLYHYFLFLVLMINLSSLLTPKTHFLHYVYSNY